MIQLLKISLLCAAFRLIFIRLTTPTRYKFAGIVVLICFAAAALFPDFFSNDQKWIPGCVAAVAILCVADLFIYPERFEKYDRLTKE